MSSLKVVLSNRITSLPPYLFAAIDQLKQEAIRQGKDVINLGIGDPDLPTPTPIIERLSRAAADPRNHQYPSYEGMLSFRQAVAQWYQTRFHVTLDPASEVVALIGSKEGIGHAPLAFINPGETALMTSPGYPVYHAGTLFAGGKSYFVPLLEKNGFLPDLESIPVQVAKEARIFFINSPNNPTAAVATKESFKSVIEFANRYNILICHDAAYSEIYYDGERPVSFLEMDGAKEVGIEFHSLSKTYNMTGWRIGFAVGNKEALSALIRVKSNLDSGVFQAVQEAGITALKMDDSELEKIRAIYQERRDAFVPGLQKLGFQVTPPKASFYLFMKTPAGVSSAAFATRLLSEAAIVATPGVGFGAAGEGYIRMTLTSPTKRLLEAIDRMEKAGITG
jgi:LL-diaminopimelate aminotransferase